MASHPSLRHLKAKAIKKKDSSNPFNVRAPMSFLKLTEYNRDETFIIYSENQSWIMSYMDKRYHEASLATRLESNNTYIHMFSTCLAC